MSWANALRKMTLTRSTLYTRKSITLIQTEPTLITEDNRAPLHFPVESFHYTRIAVLATHVIRVLLQADGSQWTLVTQELQRVPIFLP